MDRPIPYRGSITREQWLANETRIVAQLIADEGVTSAKDAVECVTSENLFCYPTERDQASIARACFRRLRALSNDSALRKRLIDLAAHGMPEQLMQVNLYAMARDNRIVWDFLAVILAQKAENLDRTLRRHEIADFVEGLRAQDERAATWSDATANKIRQVLTACLEQCGMYSRKTEELSPILLDFELEQGIRANGDEALLPALGVRG